MTYTASAQYPWLGKKDSLNLNDFKLTEFVWTVPPGWSIINGGQLQNITVRTDLGTGGNVTAQAFNRRCLGSANSSATGTLKAERKMPSPCFNTGPSLTASQYYELCGESIQNTFNCANLPANFAIPPGGVTYNWSVSPADGWTKLGELDNTVKYLTDGQKTRVITVTVTAYGVSSSCNLTIPLRLTNPLTQLKGEDFFCTTSTYRLTHPLPSGATATWKVESLDPAFTPSVSPLSGTGIEAVLSSNTGGSHCKISFKIKGCNDSLLMVDTFFAGVPLLYDMKIDGVPGSQALLCPGTHTASLKVKGANSPCVNWQNVGGNPVFAGCLEANVYLSGYNGSTELTARATNVCGTNDRKFYLIPKSFGCSNSGWGLTVYPNPAFDQVTIETKLADDSPLTEKPKMNGIRLINSAGNVAFESFETSDNIIINLSGILPGTYTLQTIVEGTPVSEIIQVKLN